MSRSRGWLSLLLLLTACAPSPSASRPAPSSSPVPAASPRPAAALPAEAQMLAAVRDIQLEAEVPTSLAIGEVKVYRTPALATGKDYVVRIDGEILTERFVSNPNTGSSLNNALIYTSTSQLTQFSALKALPHTVGDSSAASEVLFISPSQSQPYYIYLSGHPGTEPEPFWKGSVRVSESRCVDGMRTLLQIPCEE